ncbi:MAG: Lrp/AsnC ligand binding domain-containing protein [Chloroflexi bacterium]|nr:Lrp/AsnC ligand binding domain-containing protein [Chloroflexota bacterium]
MANTAKAYILIECTVGRTKEVVTGLSRLKGMKSVESVTGPYDVVAIVELNTLNEIGDLVTQNIHPITGITRTITCLVV